MLYSQIRVSELKLRADRPVLLISQYIKKIRHKTMTHSQTEHLYIPSRTHRVELKQIFSVLKQIYHKISEDFKICLLHIWTVHIYRLYRRQCAKYTYIYSVHIVYYKDTLNYQRHIIHRMGTSTLCTLSIHNVVYT